jgi:hypothetical protein
MWFRRALYRAKGPPWVIAFRWGEGCMGAVRRSKAGGKTIYCEAGAWYEPKTRMIHISIPGHASFHSTVSNDPASKRYHPNLFKKLKALLQDADRWPSDEP